MRRAWLIRAGGSGENESEAIESGLAVVGYDEVADLSRTSSREEVAGLVAEAYPDSTKGRMNNLTGQLFALRHRIEVGDLVVLPLKSTSQLALGVVTGAYEHRLNVGEGTHHVLPVRWARTDVPRTAIQQDLLYSLGAFMTVCQISRNDGAWRLGQVMETGHDPGPREETPGNEVAAVVEEAEDATSNMDLGRIATDRMLSYIGTRFHGHAMEQLVAAVLRAEDFYAEVAPEGPDGGIDIYAGKGPLGLDSPKLIVQVKSSPSPVDAKVVRELHGVLTTHGADQALLVAWGGVNRVAKAELRSQFFRVRVWDADQLVEAVTRNYDRLSEEIRAELPLRQIWTLVEDASE